MKLRFVEVGKALGPGDFLAVERKIGEQIPVSMVRLYEKYNGGKVDEGRRIFIQPENGVEYEVKHFLPMLHRRFNEDSLVEDSYIFLVREKKLIPRGYIPFAMDSGGFRFCVNVEDENVYFFNFDTEDAECGREWVAGSIEAFVDGLLTEDEAFG